MKVGILQPVRHDGKRYGPGDTAELPTNAALALIACGAAEAAAKSSSKAVTKTVPVDPALPTDLPADDSAAQQE